MAKSKSSPTFDYFSDINEPIIVVNCEGLVVYINEFAIDKYEFNLEENEIFIPDFFCNNVSDIEDIAIFNDNRKFNVLSKSISIGKTVYFRFLILSQVDGADEVKNMNGAALFPLLFNNPNVIIFLYNGLTKTIDYISKSAFAFFGSKYKNIIGKHLNQLILMVHPEDREALEKKLEDIRSSDVLVKPWDELEIRIRNKNFEFKWIKVSLSIYSDKYGRIEYIAGIVNDITGQKIIEEKLIEDEKILQALLISSGDSTFDYNLKSGIVKYNYSFAKDLGYKYNEFYSINKHWSSFIHFDDKKEADESLQLHLMGNTSKYEDEFRMKTRDGGFKWMQCRGVVTDRDEIGKPIRMLGIFRDINEIKAKETDSSEIKTVYDRILRKSGEGFIVLNNKGKITECNKSFEKITGLDAEFVIGKYVWDLQANISSHELNVKNSIDRVRVYVLEFMRNGELPWKMQNYEAKIYRTDGSIRYIKTEVHLVPAKTGNNAIAIMTDITDLKTAQLNLDNNNKLNKALFSLTNEVFYKIDLNDLTYDYLSPAAESLVGSRNSYTWRMGFNYYIGFVHYDDIGVIQEIKNLLSNPNNLESRDYVFNYRLQLSDNNIIFIEDLISIIRSDENTLVVGRIKDVSQILELNKDLNSMSESVALYEEFYTDILLKISPTGDVIYSNSTYLELFNSNNITGQKINELPRHNNFIIPDEYIKSTQQETNYVTFTNTISTNSGKKSFEWFLHSTFDSQGVINEIICYGKDITRVKRAEEKLNRINEKSESIFNLYNSPCFELDKFGKITKANDSAFRLFDNSSNKIIGARFLELANVETDISSMGGTIFDTQYGTDIFLESTIKVLEKYRRYEWILRPVYDEGEFVGAIVIGSTSETDDEIVSRKGNMKELLQYIPKPIIIIDISGSVVEWNLQQENITGIRRADAINSKIWDIIKCADNNTNEFQRVLIKGAIDDISSGGFNISKTLDNRFIKPNGEIFIGELELFPMIYGDEKLIGIFNIDNTSEYHTLNEIKESEYKYKTAFYNTPFPLVVSDISGIILHFNDSLSMITGYYEVDLYGKTILDIVANEDYEKIIRSRSDLVSGKLDLVFDECNLLNKSGDRIKAVFASTLVKDISGKPLYFISQAQNTNIFKSAELEVEKLKLGFEKFVSKLPMLIWSVNKDEIIDYVLGNALNNSNFKAQEYINIPVSKALIAQPKLLQDYMRARQGNSFSTHHEIGDHVYEVWFNPVYTSAGIIDSVIGFVINITQEKIVQDELKRTIKELTDYKEELEYNKERLEKLNRKLIQSEEDLKKINSGKDKFISILAHDIKSPLQGLINIASYIQLDFDNIERSEAVDLLEVISDSAEKINVLLDNLLLWIKIQNNSMPSATYDDINILDQINSIKDLFKPALIDKKIKIETLISAADSIYLDKYIFQVLLRNLLSNAIKFSHFAGKIEVEFETFDSYDVLTVRDFGVGMSEEKRAQLFDFTKMQSTPGTAKEKGAGLGLVICGELIDKMGGFINVKSEISRGTEISVGFPIKTR